jgi:Putative auto-transporter adhesin, head GIN domain
MRIGSRQNSIPSILFLAGCIFFTACGKDEIENTTINIALPPYTEIDLDAVFDVEFMEADYYSLEISGRKDIAEKVTYQVHNGILTLNNEHGKLWYSPDDNKIKLIVTGKGLQKINADETCNIQSLTTITSDTFGLTLGGKLNIAHLNLDCTLFYYYNTSPVGGHIYLEGHSDNIRMYNGSLMAVDARNLTCDYATVETSSKTDMHVFVDTHLYYSIRGTGNIYVYGSPDEIIAGELFSTGRLIPQ